MSRFDAECMNAWQLMAGMTAQQEKEVRAIATRTPRTHTNAAAIVKIAHSRYATNEQLAVAVRVYHEAGLMFPPR